MRSERLEDKNAKLKTLLAEVMLDSAILKDVASKNGNAWREGPCVFNPGDDRSSVDVDHGKTEKWIKLT